MRLLIVDDDAQMRRLLVSLLSLYGVKQCLTAGDAAEAAAVLGLEEVDGIVLDLMMPGMNGVEFLKLLRDHPDKRGLPVLIVSADSVPDRVSATAELGAFDFLVKPIRPVAAGERLQRFIAHCRATSRHG